MRRHLSATIISILLFGWTQAVAASTYDEAKEAFFRDDFSRAHDLCIQTDYANSDAQCANLLGLIAEKGFAKERTPLEFFLISEKLGNYKGAYNAAQRLFNSDPQRAFALFAKSFPGAVRDNNDLLAAQSLTMLTWGELTRESGQPCQSAIGQERSSYLTKLCSRISPATNPPCNAENSCKQIADEIIRGCQLADKIGQSEEFCPPFSGMTKIVVQSAPQTPTSVQNSPPSPTPPATGNTTSPAQNTGSGSSIVGKSGAFIIVVLLAMVVLLFLRKMTLRTALGLGAAVVVIGGAAAIHPGLAILLVALSVVVAILRLIKRGLGKAFATKCPKCKTRMESDGEEVIDRDERTERRNNGIKPGVYLVEDFTIRKHLKCPSCGFQTHRDVVKSKDIGIRNDLDLR